MYETVQGDTWDIIAIKVYGSLANINELMDANRAYIDTVMFNSGIKITTPELISQQSSKLPPWKR
jgi:phage tail protein X